MSLDRMRNYYGRGAGVPTDDAGYCLRCGFRLEQNDRVCSRCGLAIGSDPRLYLRLSRRTKALLAIGVLIVFAVASILFGVYLFVLGGGKKHSDTSSLYAGSSLPALHQVFEPQGWDPSALPTWRAS